MAREEIKCNFTLYRWEPGLRYRQIVVLQNGENIFQICEMSGRAIQIAPLVADEPIADHNLYADESKAIREAERLRDNHLANGWTLHPEERGGG